jgi:hypothetical protein
MSDEARLYDLSAEDGRGDPAAVPSAAFGEILRRLVAAGLYAFRDDMPEVYRRLVYDLDLFWDSNDSKIKWLTRAYTVAATALVVEILSLVALLGDNVF